ncbi:signal peptide, CUB and EGF-like domain-containing protein 1, partial [Aplysia californica]|uniref:Signal peptide, CUB and EGF-like domain-containing protein 1 n=1 Tax=Aplysia californica TaxID=6500 RepID=A0ABM1AD74_APLCA
IPGPVIYTCDPVGNWDPERRYTPYRVTPCGAVSAPRRQLVVKILYVVPTTQCPPAQEALERELLNTQKQLNVDWSSVCTASDCSDTVISVTCTVPRRTRRQAQQTTQLAATLTLKDIGEEVVSTSGPTVRMRTEDLYESLIVRTVDNPFDYTRFIVDAVPDSFQLIVEPECDAPKVFHDGQCVSCGPGTYYDSASVSCKFCPVGEYQPDSDQEQCLPCPTATTTRQMGAYSA